MKSVAAHAKRPRDRQAARQFRHAVVKRGIETGHLRCVKSRPAQFHPEQIARQVQRRKTGNAMQPLDFGRIQKSRCVGHLAAMYEAMTDCIRHLTTQILQQCVKSFA